MASVAITWTLYVYLGAFQIGPPLVFDLPTRAACMARHNANVSGTICLPGLSEPPHLNPIRTGRVDRSSAPAR